MVTANVTPAQSTASAKREAVYAQYLSDTQRFLTTILVTDIVDSTKTAALVGDRCWGELLAAHYSDCDALVAHAGGELVSTTGDGIVAIFDGPTRAVRAGIAIQALAREAGLAVRVGVHTGELERMADGVTGLAIHIATRVCALGTGGKVLATDTVRELTLGSLLQFESCGRRELRGVPGDFAVYLASDSG
jgi:class 3 adenylate cyclase